MRTVVSAVPGVVPGVVPGDPGIDLAELIPSLENLDPDIIQILPFNLRYNQDFS